MKKKKNKNKIIIPKKSEILSFCKDVVDRIKNKYGMSDYRTRIIINLEHNGDVLANIMVDNEYLRATINIFPVFVEKYRQKKFDELREALCHETFHIKTSKIEEMAVSRWGTPEAVRSEAERITETCGRMAYEIMELRKEFKK